jgi:tripartite-type tricarboxylate transporter receptor subunit TctC
MISRGHLRTLWQAALAAGVLALSSQLTPVSAQGWPNRTVTVVVPLPGGSGSDVLARIVMDQLSKQLGRPFIIENRPGAGATIGANLVAKSAPDGYTLLATGGISIAHALYTNLPYDSLRDFVPVVPLGQQPVVAVTSPAKGYKSMRDLIAAAKANPGKLNYSSAGVGSISHFATERLLASTGTKIQNIPFKGAAEATTDVVAGRSDFSIEPIVSVISLVGDGQLVALAVSSRMRTNLLPDVPTMVEAGMPADAVYPFWTGLYVPAGTPREIVDILNREVIKAVTGPTVKAQLAKLGAEPMPMNPDQFAAFVKEDIEGNVTLVKAAGIPRL